MIPQYSKQLFQELNYLSVHGFFPYLEENLIFNPNISTVQCLHWEKTVQRTSPI